MNNETLNKVKFFDQTDNLKEFISVLRKNEPFTPEEEIDAFKRYKNGSQEAFNEIIIRNQRYVYSIAKEYARDESEVMDYVNEGNIGLIQAINNFDLSRGLKFITIAVWYIRRSMNGYLVNERDMITKSNNAKISKKRLDSIKNRFYVENGRYPSFDEIKDILAEKYNIDVKDIVDLYDVDVSSINTVIDGSDDYTIEDSDDYNSKTCASNEYENGEDREYIKSIVSKILTLIPKEQREIVKKVYNIGYDDYTIAKVCEEYGMDENSLKEFLEKKVFAYIRQEAKELELVG